MKFVLVRANHYKRFDLSDYADELIGRFNMECEFIKYEEWEIECMDLAGYHVLNIQIETIEELHKLKKAINKDIIIKDMYFNGCNYVVTPTLMIYDYYIE